jgi:hypothetical protein
VTSSLTKARRLASVHFRLVASFEAEAHERYLRQVADQLETDPGDFVALAEHPLCFVLEGERSSAGFRATAAIEASGRVKRYEIAHAKGKLSVKLGGRWLSLGGPLGRLFVSETFGALIPGEACVRQESEGCDRVDFRPPLERGRIGRLIDGEVGSRADQWALSGHLDPDEFSAFSEGAPRTTYEPFARSGRILFTVAKGDGLPRELDFRYDFDRGDIEAHSGISAGAYTHRSGHVNIRLSRWGEPVELVSPRVARPSDRLAIAIFTAFFEAASLHY